MARASTPRRSTAAATTPATRTSTPRDRSRSSRAAGRGGALNEIQCRPNFTTGGGLCQTTGTNGLSAPTDVAVSPDNRFVYAVSNASSSIIGFDRATSGPDVGKLGGTTNCLAAKASNGSPNCGAAPGLTTANGLATAPDGNDVYVASQNQGIAALRRNAVSGVLSFNECFGNGGCTADAAIEHSLGKVAVSPDGRTVYAVGSDFTDGWLRSYRRDPASGDLTPLACLSNLGANGCTTAAGLKNALDVKVSPDGNSVYVASGE